MAVNPTSLVDDSLNISYQDPDTGLGLTEQLYTARGSQGMGTSDKIIDYGIYAEDFDSLVLLL